MKRLRIQSEESPFPRLQPWEETVYAPLYDYRVVRSILAYQCFFQHPVGVAVEEGVRTQRDTNMMMPGSMPAGNQFLITGLRVLFIPDVLGHRINRHEDEQDVNRMLLGGELRLRIGNREYVHDAPLAKFPSCLPKTWMAELAYLNADDEEARWRAVYDPSVTRAAGMAYYKITPLYIPANMHFMVEIMHEPQALNTPGKLGVILDGHLWRAGSR